jgi:hypothetical protein
MGGEKGHALGEINGRPTTERNQPVALALTIECHGGLSGLLGRVRRCVVEDRRLIEHRRCVPQPIEKTHLADAVVRHDQRPLDTELLKIALDLPTRASLEADRGEIGDEGHGRLLLAEWTGP